MWIPGEGAEDVFLEWEEVWCFSMRFKYSIQLLTEKVDVVIDIWGDIFRWWVPVRFDIQFLWALEKGVVIFPGKECLQVYILS